MLIADTLPTTVSASGNPCSIKKLSAVFLGGMPRVANGELGSRKITPGCSTDQHGIIAAVITSTRTTVSSAIRHSAKNPSGSEWETEWFGEFSAGRHQTILTAYQVRQGFFPFSKGIALGWLPAFWGF